MNKFVLKNMLLVMAFGVSAVGCASTDTDKATQTLTISQTKTTARDDHFDGRNHDGHNHDGHSHEIPRAVGTKADFESWLAVNPWQNTQVTRYENYLVKQLGKHHTPPLHQLLTTARSWQECGFEPYQVPPDELWHNMLPTLRLYAKLRQLGILPPNTEIRSVYRNPELNRCAGGAAGSKHLTNGAIDIWVPTYDKDSWQMKNLQNRLCQFWIDEGSPHNFGLGIYATGAIHLDTQGYRKWGGEHSELGSPCRYIVPKPEMGFSTISITQTPIVPSVSPTTQYHTPQALPQVSPQTQSTSFATQQNVNFYAPANPPATQTNPSTTQNGINLYFGEGITPPQSPTTPATGVPTLPIIKPIGEVSQ